MSEFVCSVSMVFGYAVVLLCSFDVAFYKQQKVRGCRTGHGKQHKSGAAEEAWQMDRAGKKEHAHAMQVSDAITGGGIIACRASMQVGSRVCGQVDFQHAFRNCSRSKALSIKFL